MKRKQACLASNVDPQSRFDVRYNGHQGIVKGMLEASYQTQKIALPLASATVGLPCRSARHGVRCQGVSLLDPGVTFPTTRYSSDLTLFSYVFLPFGIYSPFLNSMLEVVIHFDQIITPLWPMFALEMTVVTLSLPPASTCMHYIIRQWSVWPSWHGCWSSTLQGRVRMGGARLPRLLFH